MKNLFLIILFLFLIINNISAQRISIDVQYAGLITGINNNSASLYIIEGNYEFEKLDISIGAEYSFINGSVNSEAISQPLEFYDINEISSASGLKVKYFPNLFRNISLLVKPYASIAGGVYLSKSAFGIGGNLLPCEAGYQFSVSNNYYIDLNVGTIIGTKGWFSLIVEVKYRISNPELTYQKPNCFDDKSTTYTEYREKVNLGMLLWSIGVQVNL